MVHGQRTKKRQRGAALDDADLDNLPRIVHEPEGVLYDNQDTALLYVFSPLNRADKKGKVVIRVDARRKGRITGKGNIRRRVTANVIRTTGYVEKGDLLQPRYELIKGEIK